MKKIYMILAAMTLLSMSLNAQTVKATKNGTAVQPTTMRANTPNGRNSAPMRATEQSTVCDGTSTSPYLPFWGLYFDDNYQIHQMIYPESLLTDLVGKQITSITFYANNAISSNLNSGLFTFKIGTTSQTTFGSTVTRITTGMTAVATGMAMSDCISGSQFVIDFSDNPFTYQGGNLVLDYQLTTLASGYNTTNFFGQNDHSNASFYSRSSSASPNSNGVYSNCTRSSFLPKVTFTYEKEDQHDLAIALSAPSTAGAGNTVDVTATVTNNGDFAENGYTVTVSDGTNIVNITAQEALGIGETTTFTVQFATSPDAGGSTVNYTATVACTDDADATNNSATASTSLVILPPPENVAATANGNNGTMTWDAPSNLPIIQTTVPETVTENFDDTNVFPSFSIGGITATQHTGTIGDWTVYTPSSDYVYGPRNVTFTNDNDPQAWAVMNPTAASWNIGSAHSGSQFMISFCDAGDENGDNIQTTDHWLISPELSGNAQTISFWERVITAQYGDETYEVLASSTDNNPASFSLVESFTSDATSWTQRTASLPAGTKYFAIRHTAYDIFGVMIDDVTYEISNVVETQLAPESYNIYLDGELLGNVDANTFSYTFTNVTDGEHECAVSAVYSLGESVAVPATFTTQPKTEAPSISYETVGDNVVITATGNGTVTLTIPGYPEASGTGSASITVPRHMQDYTVTATATAQEADHLASDPTTQQVSIPGLASEGGWMLMEGTYTNGSDQLSFTHRNSDNVVEPILFVDQFNQSTLENNHPDEYLYQVSEKVSDDIQDARETSEVPVHVHKTYSTINAPFTEAEVLADEYGSATELRPNVINGIMSYDIKAESDIYFYGLYRGNRGEEKPGAVDDLETNTYRISKIQKDLNEDFFNENMLTNAVVPKYNHIEAGDVERIDKEYVDGIMTQDELENNFLAYVPVIWSYGDHTGRPVGNNSYGSDIKISELGNLNITIGGARTNDKPTGRWTYEGEEYCVYAPVITIDGIVPKIVKAEDGDTYVYEPYMYRAWCTYERARNFGHNNGPGGHKELIDAGERKAPFLIGEVKVAELPADSSATHVFIGSLLDHGTAQTQSSFGVPVTEVSGNVKFIVRFYYKKTVTDAAHSTSGGRDGGSESYGMAQRGGDGGGIPTGINELSEITYVVSKTYVNAQGMQSDKPFDGLNIVVTRFSDGTTTTTKVVR